MQTASYRPVHIRPDCAARSQGPRELKALENWQIPFAVAKLDPGSYGRPHRDQSPWRETPLVPCHLKVLKGAGQDMKPKLSLCHDSFLLWGSGHARLCPHALASRSREIPLSLACSDFPQMREREAKLWDTRLFSSALASVTLDTSPG